MTRRIFCSILLSLVAPSIVMGAEPLVTIAKRLDDLGEKFEVISGEAIATEVQLVHSAVAPDGAVHYNVQAETKTAQSFDWDYQKGRFSVDLTYTAPVVFVSDSGERWENASLNGFNWQTRLGPNEMLHMSSNLYGHNINGWPDPVHLPPYTTRVGRLHSSDSAPNPGFDFRRMWTFGNAPPPYLTWGEYLRLLDQGVTAGAIEMDSLLQTQANGEKRATFNLRLKPNQDELSFSFDPERNWVPTYFRDTRDGVAAMEQTWTWQSLQDGWFPRTYSWKSTRIGHSGGDCGNYSFSLKPSPNAIDISISSLNFRKYDRFLDEVKNQLYVFDGTELVTIRKFESDRASMPAHRMGFLIWTCTIATLGFVLYR